jgi:hypothetical protein
MISQEEFEKDIQNNNIKYVKISLKDKILILLIKIIILFELPLNMVIPKLLNYY